MTPLTVQEEALVFARIPLREPTGLQEVDPSQGIIKSPETAKVIRTFVTNPLSNGGHRVFPGDKRFLREVWTTPRIQNNRRVSAPVGGFVERVLVKAGDGVQKNQELVHLRYPFLEGRPVALPPSRMPILVNPSPRLR